MTNREVFRPRTNLNFAVLGFFITGLFTWSNFYQTSTAIKIATSLEAIFAVIVLYLFLIRPKIIFVDEGMIIINPLAEFTIGWADLITFDTRWTFTAQTKDFKVNAFAAPASGKRRKSIHASEVRGLEIESGDSVRVADSPLTDSGAAAYLARIRIQRFHQSSIKNTLPTGKKQQPQLFLLAGLALMSAVVITLSTH